MNALELKKIISFLECPNNHKSLQILYNKKMHNMDYKNYLINLRKCNTAENTLKISCPIN